MNFVRRLVGSFFFKSRSLFTAGGAVQIWGGGQEFQCKEMGRWGAKFQCKPLDGAMGGGAKF